MKNSISIIFPCYNEEDRLKYAFADIKKFYRSKKFRNFEIIFVNDGSSDNTLDVLRKIQKKCSNSQVISLCKFKILWSKVVPDFAIPPQKNKFII